MKTTNWMLYGATGYTGRLIAAAAVAAGCRPILAGRSYSVTQLAREYDLPSRIFALEQSDQVARQLEDVALVLNCAGPFSATAGIMMEACLIAGCHYLDITGEIAVFERAARQHERAQQRGVAIMPGVGFDVIPTDCLAVALKRALPDADELHLGFDSRSPISRGTAKTSIEGLAEGGKARIDGQLVSVPFAWKERRIDFGFGPKLATTIPWGDLATAWRSTGIGNIQVFLATPASAVRKMKLGNWLKPVLSLSMVQNYLKDRVEQGEAGPDAAQRGALRTAVWGEAINRRGDKKVARIEVANGYQLTVDGALEVVRRLLAQAPAQGGYYTPAMLYGPELVEALPGSGRIAISDN